MTALGLALVAALAAPGLPTGEGLPIRVKAAVNFVDVISLNESAHTFKATIDVRLRWRDERLVFRASDAPVGFREVNDAAVTAMLADVWAPDIAVINQQGDATNTHVGLRWFPDGRLELMRRSTGEFSIAIDAHKFPFDYQDLVIDLGSLREPASRVALVFDQDDLTMSQVSRRETLEGWTIGAVDVRRVSENGWYGATQSHVRASLRLARDPRNTVGPIFVPILAGVLIPFLALWLNKAVDHGFKIEAFELANVLIGGLFALIALNFTVNSAYTNLAGDNPISRLFAINFILLGIGLVINLAMFRYNLIHRLFGKHVHYEAFAAVLWLLPVLTIIAVAWVLAMAGA